MREQRQHRSGLKVYPPNVPDVAWQREAAAAVRVRRQSFGRYDPGSVQGRPVHRLRQALPGKPYDGQTLATVIPEIEIQIGANLTRIVTNRGYNARPSTSSRSISPPGDAVSPVKRQLRRRSAIEPDIGCAKNDHRMGGNHFPEPKATPPPVTN
ncbi:MAG TPA: hypothetical protein VJY34_13830 [Roseiarcus sp.]|nr:hypothetical protein [Roseiarcus sp.]